jgi:hypothetical protein
MRSPARSAVPSLCAAVLAVAVPAVHAADPVPVGGFAVDPMGNLGSDGIEIHPKALLGVQTNSNLYATEDDPESDVGVRALAGVLLRWNASETWTWTGDLEAEALEYAKSENDDAGMIGGRAVIGGRYAGVSDEADLEGGYERFADPLIETGENIERQTVSALAGWTRLGITDRVSIGVDARYTDYLEDSPSGSFTEDDRDIVVGKLNASWGRAIGQDDYWYLRAQGERSDYVENTLYNDSWAAAAALGLTWAVGERARLVVDGGLKVRRYDEAFTTADDDQTVVGPFGQLSFQWPWEEGSRLDITGFADTDNSISANAQSILGLRGDVRWRLRDRLTALGGLEAVRTGDLGSGDTEQRTTAKGQAGIEYALRDGIAMRGLVRGTISEADLGDDYDRFEALADLAVVF